MDVIKNILINYWPQILAILLFIVSFILQCLKKKPVKVVTNIIEFIFETAIEAVKVVEEAFKGYKTEKMSCFDDGFDALVPVSTAKLSAAIEYISEAFAKQFPELDFLKFREVAVNIVEDILTTPQKHVDK